MSVVPCLRKGCGCVLVFTEHACELVSPGNVSSRSLVCKSPEGGRH